MLRVAAVVALAEVVRHDEAGAEVPAEGVGGGLCRRWGLRRQGADGGVAVEVGEKLVEVGALVMTCFMPTGSAQAIDA